jgi:hypothetical protein
MRRLALMLCLLLSANFLLAPFGSLHAHTGAAHDHAVHGGHIHDRDHGTEGDIDGLAADDVVDVDIVLADQKPSKAPILDWHLVAYALAITGCERVVSGRITEPPPDHFPDSRLACWPPPLRGPPPPSI